MNSVALLTPVGALTVALILLVICILAILAYAIREIGRGWEDMERLKVIPPTPERDGLFSRFLTALLLCVSALLAALFLIIFAN